MFDIFIKNNLSIKDAIAKLNKTQLQCLLVINRKKEFLGTITDGDIRRVILKRKNYNVSINSIYNKKPLILFNRPNNFEKNNILKKMYSLNLNVVPIIEKKTKKVIDYISGSKIEKTKIIKKRSNSKISVVIMAGGLGTRLIPFTKILPKPLIPLDDKPIIEHILDKFLKSNFKKFITILNFKHKIIESYISATKYKKYVKYYVEKKMLGTIGGVRNILQNLSSTFILTNSDIIIDADYSKIIDFHKNNNFQLTLVVAKKNFNIPYGFCEADSDGNLIKFSEKPSLELLTNIGFYVMEKKIITKIKKNKKLNFDKFIQLAIKDKYINIGVYPIDDSLWFDVGEWTKYNKVAENWLK